MSPFKAPVVPLGCICIIIINPSSLLGLSTKAIFRSQFYMYRKSNWCGKSLVPPNVEGRSKTSKTQLGQGTEPNRRPESFFFDTLLSTIRGRASKPRFTRPVRKAIRLAPCRILVTEILPDPNKDASGLGPPYIYFSSRCYGFTNRLQLFLSTFYRLLPLIETFL
ncbi:hypothetical protein F5Y05DRAFT_239258 [Hypoxylon sp. FL0543]|nr:hypothetical protein F5Y05DRAFT_239258 [Hypoxylon sp. FL0543]